MPHWPPRMPETSFYYHVAYTVALGIYAVYAVSLYTRRKRLRRQQWR
jgi:hypothetical protein